MTRERGSGSIFRASYRDKKTGARVTCRTWTMKLWRGGHAMKRSAGTSSRAQAVKALELWKHEVAGGDYLPNVDKTALEDLRAILLDEYRANKRKSTKRVGHAIDHLRDFFGGLCPVRAITSDRIAQYIRHRQEEEHAANATVNRELSALGRMFKLGQRAERLVKIPVFSLLVERNARQGFFEADQFQAVRRHLPEPLQTVADLAYLTGWRITSELLTRQWRHVDLKAGWLRLDPEETKNREGRQFPLFPALRAVLEAQRDRTTQVELATGQVIPWVLHRQGRQIKVFKLAWRSACRAAGVPGRLPHDFRRTAVRNLERAGVSRSAAMKMVGHQTEAIYRRYAIVAENDMVEAGVKLQDLHDAVRLGASSGLSEVTRLQNRA